MDHLRIPKNTYCYVTIHIEHFFATTIDLGKTALYLSNNRSSVTYFDGDHLRKSHIRPLTKIGEERRPQNEKKEGLKRLSFCLCGVTFDFLVQFS